MKTLQIAVAALFWAVSLQSAAAEEMAEAMDGLCVKMKGCALEQMGNADDMNEQMKEMVMQSLNPMCDGMERNFEAAQGHALYPVATACLQSMQSQSCEELSAGDESRTPECVRYREEAKKYE
jgi:hypothetical protein